MITENKVVAGSFELFLNNGKLPEYITSTIKEVFVEDAISKPAMFKIRIEIGDFLKNMSKEKIDVDTFKTGDEVKIFMGFDKPEPMMVGEITSIEPSFQEPFSMEIRGYDRLYRLNFETGRVPFTNQKDSEIASSIASKAKLTPQAEDTGTVYPYVFQNNKNNYDFLLERANRIGYEMFVDDKTLIFRKPQDTQTPSLTLNYGLELQSFSINMRGIPAGNKVESRSWDPKSKKEIVYTAEGKASSESKELFPASGKQSPPVLDEVAIDAADAEKIAKVKADSIMKNVITGEGKCCGNPKVRAGKTVDIKEIGDRLSGAYYIVSSTHSITDNEYTTTFKVRKSSI